MAIFNGFNKLRSNMRRKVNQIERGQCRALMKSGRLVERRAKQKTPVEWGNLKASGYSRWESSGKTPLVEIGYTADYAVPVHEDLESWHNVGEAKFLENALNESEKDVYNLLKQAGKSSTQ